MLYHCSFAPPGNAEGRWWTRKDMGLWLPPLSAADQELKEFLKSAGWIAPAAPENP